MATGGPGTSSSSGSSGSQPPVEEMMNKIVEELMEERERMRAEAGKEETCKKNPNFSTDVTLSSLKNLKLMLESELEALQDLPLEQLPSEPALLQDLAEEDVQSTAHRNGRTLEFNKKKLEELKETKRKYETKVKRATMVSQALNKLHSQHLSDEEKFIALERKYNRSSVLFRFLREHMHYILLNLYPNEISSPKGIKDMEELMDCLVSRMMEHPNEPYVQLDDTMEESLITLLLAANLITRHPTDITAIRFIDPRV